MHFILGEICILTFFNVFCFYLCDKNARFNVFCFSSNMWNNCMLGSIDEMLDLSVSKDRMLMCK